MNPLSEGSRYGSWIVSWQLHTFLNCYCISSKPVSVCKWVRVGIARPHNNKSHTLRATCLWLIKCLVRVPVPVMIWDLSSHSELRLDPPWLHAIRRKSCCVFNHQPVSSLLSQSVGRLVGWQSGHTYLPSLQPTNQVSRPTRFLSIQRQSLWRRTVL